MKYALNIFPSIVLFLFFIPFLFRQVTELRILLFKQRKLIKRRREKNHTGKFAGIVLCNRI